MSLHRTAFSNGEAEMNTNFAFMMKGRLRSERGATSIEYAILGALIAAVIAMVVATLGGQVQLLFQSATKGW